MDDLTMLLAEREITRELIRFARAMDARDWETLREIMFENATADLGTGPLTGSDAVIDLIRNFLDPCGPTQHLLGNILVDIDGDSATSRAYVQDMHLGAGNRAHLTFATLGDYHDEWQHDGHRWRLRHRTKYSHAQIGSMDVFRPSTS